MSENKIQPANQHRVLDAASPQMSHGNSYQVWEHQYDITRNSLIGERNGYNI
jgi:hypothetical protein